MPAGTATALPGEHGSEALHCELAEVRARLATAERHHRTFLDDAVDDAVITFDLDGRVTAWNAGAHHMLGWTADEMRGQPVATIFTPADRARGVPEAALAALRRGARGRDERWHLRRDGSRFCAAGETIPLTDEEGTATGAVMVLRDRTDARAATERHRQDAAFLRSVPASSGDCIKVLDLDARLVFMSEGGQRVMEVSDFNAIQGCHWPNFWHGDGHVAAREAVAAARAGGIGHFQGAAETMAGRRRWWDVQVTPILGIDGRPEKLLSVSRDMTEAAAARERLDLALDAGTVAGTWVWDIPADRLTADHRFARTFSLDPERLAAGIPHAAALSCLHPDDRVAVAGCLARAMADGARLAAEFRVGQPDGAWRWVETNGHCEQDARGQPWRFPGILFDIDRRKRHELRREALLEFGEHLRALSQTDDTDAMAHAAAETMGRTLRVARAGYGTVDEAEARLTVNRDWCADSTVASVAGAHALSDYGNFLDALRRGETVSIPDVAVDARTRSGTDRLRAVGVTALLNVPLMLAGRFVALLFLNDGAVRVWTEDEIAFVRAVADRTWAAMQQGAAERRLRLLNQTLEAEVAARTEDRNRLWQLSTDIMLVSGLDGVIMAVNPAWTDALGWHADELVGANLFELIHDQDRAASIACVRDIADARMLQRFENRTRTRDGAYRWINWTASPGDGLIVGVGRDATDERERAAALQQAEDKLRQAQKMEAVGQLTGGLAHDFNNMLTGMTGSLELLQTRVAQGRLQDVDRYIEAAQGAARRAAALTHRLLAFSRRQALDPRPTDIDRLIRGMEELIRRTVGPGIVLEPLLGHALWPTLVDPSQLENALLNLCINARDAMPGGGRITIETGHSRLDAAAAAALDLKPGAYVSMCVSDTGTGMSPEVIARAFDPFFTTKTPGQGTGLGLSMIYGFARQSGGQVRISSDAGAGTTVCLYLPRHPGRADPAADDPPERPAVLRAGRGETVLVVDDEPTVRMLVAEVLEELGYLAIEAADGHAGLKVLRSDARIDLLVTDMGLPGGLSGRQVADAARVTRPGLKVLFITGYAEEAREGRADLPDGMHVLSKPFAIEALATRIRDLLGKT